MNTPFESEINQLDPLYNEQLKDDLLQKAQIEDSECADDENFALPAVDSFGAYTIKSEDVEEMKKPTNVGIIGGASTPSMAAVAAAGISARPMEETDTKPTPKPKPSVAVNSAARRRQQAMIHNNQPKAPRFMVAKLRTKGLTVRIDVKSYTQRQIDESKECGVFAYFTKNTAVSINRLKRLGWAVETGATEIAKDTLNWLLDQTDENFAFELRNHRLDSSKSYTRLVTKTAEEWIAKGFNVRNGNVEL